MLGGLLSAPSVARTKTADVTHHPAKSAARDRDSRSQVRWVYEEGKQLRLLCLPHLWQNKNTVFVCLKWSVEHIHVYSFTMSP